MESMQQLNRTIMEREETKEVCKVFATIIASLHEYENQKIEEWGRDVESSSQAMLKLPLLRRNPQTRLLTGIYCYDVVRPSFRYSGGYRICSICIYAGIYLYIYFVPL
jgi:hypothetical protein